MLAAQIEQGVKPDVFASANTKLPDMLYAKGLVEQAGDVRREQARARGARRSTKVTSITDLEKPGVTIAIGSATRPDRYLHAQGACEARAGARAKILANVRSEEPDVTGIVGKLTEGAVDAGFTYVTDVKATRGKLQAIALPGLASAGGRLRRGGREGDCPPGAGSAVHHRPGQRRRAAEPPPGRVPAAAGAVSTRPWFPLASGGRARARAGVPRPAGRRDLHATPRPAQLLSQSRRPGRDRRAPV